MEVVQVISHVELQDAKSVVEQIATEMESDNLSLKENSALAVNLFQSMAVKRNIVLKLKKKTNKK